MQSNTTQHNTTQQPFFSVVIPVYNGLSHNLPRCLDSVWNQPIPRDMYEVICVDDCSTDGTRDFLRGYSLEHDLVPIFNEKNRRQGGARNVGIRNAKGKYILFIDQDDYFHPGIFSEIYNLLNECRLDVLVMDSIWQIDGAEENHALQHNLKFETIMTGDEFIEKNGIPFAPWKFVCDRDFLLAKDIFFKERTRIEDVDWSFRVAHAAERIRYLRQPIIHYMQYRGQTTSMALVDANTTYDTIALANVLVSIAKDTTCDFSAKVREFMIGIADNFFRMGIRNYFFFYDCMDKKVKHIQSYARRNCAKNIFCIIADISPVFYACITNMLSPVGRIVALVHLRHKYKR